MFRRCCAALSKKSAKRRAGAAADSAHLAPVSSLLREKLSRLDGKGAMQSSTREVSPKAAWSIDRFFAPGLDRGTLDRLRDAMAIDSFMDVANRETHRWMIADARGESLETLKADEALGALRRTLQQLPSEAAIGVFGGMTTAAGAQRMKAFRLLHSDIQVNEVLAGTGDTVALTLRLDGAATAADSSLAHPSSLPGHEWFAFVLYKECVSLDVAFGLLSDASGGAISAADFSVNVALDDLSCTTQLCTVRCRDVAVLRKALGSVNDAAAMLSARQEGSDRGIVLVQPIGFVSAPCSLARGAAAGAVRVSLLLRGVQSTPRAIAAALRDINEIGFVNFFGPRRFSVGPRRTMWHAHHIGHAVARQEWRSALWMLHQAGALAATTEAAFLARLRARETRKSSFADLYRQGVAPLHQLAHRAAVSAAEWNVLSSFRWRASQVASAAASAELGAPGEVMLLRSGTQLSAVLQAKLELAHSAAELVDTGGGFDDSVSFVTDETDPDDIDVTRVALPLPPVDAAHLGRAFATNAAAHRLLLGFPSIPQSVTAARAAPPATFLIARERAGATLQMKTDAQLASRDALHVAAVGSGFGLRRRMPEGLPTMSVDDSGLNARATDAGRHSAYSIAAQLVLPSTVYLSSVLRTHFEVRAAPSETVVKLETKAVSTETSPVSSAEKDSAARKVPSVARPFDDDTDSGNILRFRWKTGEAVHDAVRRGAASGNLSQPPPTRTGDIGAIFHAEEED